MGAYLGQLAGNVKRRPRVNDEECGRCLGRLTEGEDLP
jgi:hypothetical protein